MVLRSIPAFGSVRDSKERRWISIRWGTSTGVESREKDLRMTGAAGTLANWATPQVVEEQEPVRMGKPGENGERRATV
jgi:hypothetical protein